MQISLFILFFSCSNDMKSEMLYLSFQVGFVTQICMLLYICCLVKCVTVCEFFHIFRFLHLHLMEKQTC